MAIDWASDHFVRLYTRETEDDLLLSWEARALWHELLKKFDKRGLLPTRRGARGISALVRVPVEVVERALPELLEDGRILETQTGYQAPNYQSANYTSRSSAARKADERTRTQIGRRPVAGTGAQEPSNGDEGYKMSHAVTESHEESLRSDQIRSDHAQGALSSRARRSVISSDWVPSEADRALAVELGLDPETEAKEFLAYWLGEGKPKADWNQTFRARLEKRAEFMRRRRPGASGAQEERDIRDL
jgi:hypothetical protein